VHRCSKVPLRIAACALVFAGPTQVVMPPCTTRLETHQPLITPPVCRCAHWWQAMTCMHEAPADPLTGGSLLVTIVQCKLGCRSK
jgi:hypothetical protein